MLHGELAREEAGLALRERASHSLELSIDAEAASSARCCSSCTTGEGLAGWPRPLLHLSPASPLSSPRPLLDIP